MVTWPNTILLATDGSEDAALAATSAASFAKTTDSELHIISVGVVPTVLSKPSAVEPVWVEQQTKEVIEEQVKKIENLGVEVAQSHVRSGLAAEKIVKVAEEVNAGLIIMGCRGRGRVRRALLGSVSDSVVRHAHCPVMVVRGKPVIFPTKILLATDGSETATLAAKTAADLAARSGSELHVLTVGADIEVFNELVGMPPVGSYTETIDAIEQETRRVLEEQEKKIKEAGGTVEETHLVIGELYPGIGESPDRAIVHLSEDTGVGLIVMGSRGHGGLRRALIGSVSDSVVRHAHCPVLVVRPDK